MPQMPPSYLWLVWHRHVWTQSGVEHAALLQGSFRSSPAWHLPSASLLDVANVLLSPLDCMTSSCVDPEWRRTCSFSAGSNLRLARQASPVSSDPRCRKCPPLASGFHGIVMHRPRDAKHSQLSCMASPTGIAPRCHKCLFSFSSGTHDIVVHCSRSADSPQIGIAAFLHSISCWHRSSMPQMPAPLLWHPLHCRMSF
jgi:hypothetical protein